ncbi:nucleolar 10-like protein [Labeo rohita]|uniref:Nucleolar 10-like protein n=1 Tax=Labeo rohita TaxID=84645 RepID=A0A498NIH8_LABRO|nr:nucleolar 10-like protein [Labeo rohita]
MRVDLDRKLRFPTKITSTSLHPDIVMWSNSSKTVLLVELTIPWEAGMEAAWERKRLKYDDLAAECREAGWKTIIYPVELCTASLASSGITVGTVVVWDTGEESGIDKANGDREKDDLRETREESFGATGEDGGDGGCFSLLMCSKTFENSANTFVPFRFPYIQLRFGAVNRNPRRVQSRLLHRAFTLFTLGKVSWIGSVDIEDP